MPTQILDRARRLIWNSAGGRCAFTDCEQALVVEGGTPSKGTVIGVECHIVSQKDHASVARSVQNLSDKERVEYASLIENRHSADNLVLMCQTHSTLIDSIHSGYSIAVLLEMREAHYAEVRKEREAGQEARAGSLESGGRPAAASRVVLVDDVPRWQRKAVKALAQKHPDELDRFSAELGDVAAPDPAAVERAITDWPPELAEGSAELWTAVARTAESIGLWAGASEVWARQAARYNGAERARYLVLAAIAASVAGDGQRHRELLDAAEMLDPTAPRLKLQELNDSQTPEEQLVLLAGITATDAPTRSLIAAHRARAAMMLPDMDLAERSLEEAKAADPETVQVRTLEINLPIQRARVALGDLRDVSVSELRRASEEALALRDELVQMKRWDESVRLLMLAAEAPTLLGDPAEAARILELARPEEIASKDGPEVLGDAALRASVDHLARGFTEDADPGNDVTRRIRAAASLVGDRASAIATLEEVALGGGPEAELAAFHRLAACMLPIRASWNEDVAQVLAAERYARVVTDIRVGYHLVRKELAEADALVDGLPDSPWAVITRLRVAAVRGKHSAMRDAAEDVLAQISAPPLRLLAAQALKDSGDVAKAEAVQRSVAVDPDAPPSVRIDAYADLLHTLAEQSEWADMESAWEGWRQAAEDGALGFDPRLGSWHVRVANRRAYF